MSKIALRKLLVMNLSSCYLSRNFSRALLALTLLIINVRISNAEVPVKCEACGINSNLSWVHSGAATSNRDGNTLNINQVTDKVRLNWQTFNIGAGNTVNFKQPDSGSVALNKVFDPSANPSRILGNLNANGQVYIINRNGVVFGEGAKINVQGLVASTLDITDEVFENGLVSAFADTAGAAFEEAPGRVFVTDEDGNELKFQVDAQGEFILDANSKLIPDSSDNGVPYPIFIKISKNAQIETDEAGRVFIFSQNIENDGKIITPEGQAILAAGNKIYLQSSADLLGLLVEVDVGAVKNQDLEDYIATKNTAMDDPSVNGDSAKLVAGNIVNRGDISAKRGNVSLAGLAINQKGRVSATTAINQKGQIRLTARDSIDISINDPKKVTDIKRAGYVEFGEDSVTEILLDVETAEQTAIDATPEQKSLVEVSARTIALQKNSMIVAPSGEVKMSATKIPLEPPVFNSVVSDDPNARIHLAAGSLIDVSGVNVEKSMESNVLEVELRGTELADSPLQRDGILAGQKVFIDLRRVGDDGRIPIANVKGQLVNIKKTAAERSTEGGNVSLVATGHIDFDENATIDVSGGAIKYKDGFITTTELLANGEIINIHDASPDVKYDRIQGQIIRRDPKWGIEKRWNTAGGPTRRFEHGYVEGKDAGSVKFAGYHMTLDGNLKAHTRVSEFQRINQTLALGGQLLIGDSFDGVGATNHLAPHVVLQSSTQIAASKLQIQKEAVKNNQKIDDIVLLDTRYLQQGGFTRTEIYSNGKIQVDTKIDVAAGGEFKLNAMEIAVNEDITIPSGDIELTTKFVDDKVRLHDSQSTLMESIGNRGGELTIADSVTLSTQGSWVNDNPYSSHNMNSNVRKEIVALDGGNISLNFPVVGNTYVLDLGDDVTLDASAGAWVKVDGERVAGKGGDIAIELSPNTKFNIGENLAFKSYSLEKGGELKLTAPQILIGGNQESQSLFNQQILWSNGQSNTLNATDRDTLAQQLLLAYSSAANQLGFTVEAMGNELDDSQVESLSALVRETLSLPDNLADGFNYGDMKLSENVLLNDLLVPVASQFDPVGSDSDNLAMVVATLDSLDAIELPVSVFNQGGFSTYTVSSNRSDLTLLTGSIINPYSQNIVLDQNYANIANNRSLQSIGELTVLPDYARTAVDLNFEALIDGTIVNFAFIDSLPKVEMQAGSAINMEAGSSIDMVSNGAVIIHGAINAPGGEINIDVNNSNSDLFEAKRKIILADGASLSAQGTVLFQPNTEGLRIGENFNAGTISLRAKGGFVEIQDGANVDVSASSSMQHIIDPVNASASLANVATAAGAIEITASEGMLISGSLAGHSSGDNNQAGSISVDLDVSLVTDAGNVRQNAGYPETAKNNWILNLTKSKQTQESSNIAEANISIEQIYEGGFDSLYLKSDIIEVENGVHVSLDRQIILDSSVLSVSDPEDSASVLIDAPYLSIGLDYTKSSSELSDVIENISASGGAATLILGGDNTHFIDLISSSLFSVNTKTRGYGNVEIYSQGDIRLRALNGGFETAGDLNLSASQIYTSTLTQFALASTDSENGRIRISHSGNDDPSPVLSAGGTLTLSAAHIVQEGVLKAPLGSIVFDTATTGDLGTASITLTEGSVTSTAADVDLIPFGVTSQGGTQWRYNNNTQSVDSSGVGDIAEQSVQFTADSIAVNSGAKVNVAAGGDLIAYEFLLGPGGSQDVTSAKVALAENSFAILPWLKGNYAPYDRHIYESGWDTLGIGRSVVLNEAAVGLEAGEYALLPAVYALLPGAYLVTANEGYNYVREGQHKHLRDGTPLVAGTYSYLNTEYEDALTHGFAIRSGNYVRSRSEFRETLMSEFVTQKALLDEFSIPRLAQDAGRLAFIATKEISLKGDFVSGAPNGKGVAVDISANIVNIVASKDQNTAGAESLQGVLVTAQDLHNLGAESLLIGGTRQIKSDGKRHISVSAEAVNIKQNTHVSAPEIILVAGATDTDGNPVGEGNINLESNSSVTSGREIAGELRNIVVGRKEQFDASGKLITSAVNGDGALIRVANGKQVAIERVNESVAGAATQGSVHIQQGGFLLADQSMNLDASSDVILDGELQIAQGSLNIGAPKINLSMDESIVPGEVAGLTLSTQILSGFSLNELILTSRDTLDLYGNVALGVDDNNNINIVSLGISAGGINAMSNDSHSLLAAHQLTLSNPSGVASTNNNNVSGASLDLQAQFDANNTLSGQFTMGATQSDGSPAGSFEISNFDSVSIRADGKFQGQSSGELSVQAELNIEAQKISADSGAVTIIDSQDNPLTIGKSDITQQEFDSIDSLGGQLKFRGTSVNYHGHIELPSGVVQLLATGDDGAVTLSRESVIDVSGRTRLMGGELLVGTWGGDVNLEASNGNILMHEGAIIDVSGANPDGEIAGTHAGGVSVFAGNTQNASNGIVDIQASLLANTHQGSSGGRFSLNAERLMVTDSDLSPLSQLNASLNAGNFSESRKIRLRSGDLNIDNSGERAIVAKRVELTADTGGIVIEGTIDARSDKGGKVELYARDDVVISGSARIDVGAQGEGQPGGDVLLSTRLGSIHVETADRVNEFTINLAGSEPPPDAPRQDEATHGKLRLRSARLGNNTVAIGNIDFSAIGSAKGIDIEAYKVYNIADVANGGTIINQNVINSVKTDTNLFMANADVILDVLNPAVDPRVRLIPVSEIESESDLTLANEWDFIDWKYNGNPGVLSLRATQNLTIAADLTDGVYVEKVLNMSKQRLSTEESWSYHLVAGADNDSANPNSVIHSDDQQQALGDITLESGKKIRSGTGNIVLISAHDLTLEDKNSAIYTSGVHTESGSLFNNFFLDRTISKEFPESGGDIHIEVGNDISSVLTDKPFSGWLWRQGGAPGTSNRVPTEWAVDIDKFSQGVATFGGGDIYIEAGSNINSLSANIVTTGIQRDPYKTDIVVRGGGKLSVFAGGSVSGGSFYVARGDGIVHEKSGLNAEKIDKKASSSAILLALGDSNIYFESVNGVNVESVYHPTVLSRAVPAFATRFKSEFFTYSDDSTLSLQSLAGNINLRSISNTHSSLKDTYVYPASVYAYAFDGSIYSPKPFTTYPSSHGNLQLLAGTDVVIDNIISLSDYNVKLLSTFEEPKPFSVISTLFQNEIFTSHSEQILHKNDSEPVYIIADRGSIKTSQVIYLAKQARIIAGKDIQQLWISGQNINESDVTLISAGRDIRYPTENNNGIDISVGGPGRLDVLAGRHIDLGGSGGISSSGNLRNPALAETGADITLLAGIGDAVEGVKGQSFIRSYLKIHPAQAQFRQAIHNISGDDALSLQNALSYFSDSLSAAQQTSLLDSLQLSDADLTMLHKVAAYESQIAGFTAAMRNVSGDQDININSAIQQYRELSDEQRAQLQEALDTTEETLAQILASHGYRTEALAQVRLNETATSINLPGDTDNTNYISEQALLTFLELNATSQLPVIVGALFNELRESGRFVANQISDGYSRAYTAIETLFPQSNDYAGDLSMFASRIYTLKGGDINILVPGGLVNGGITDPTKKASDLGVVAQAQGAVSTFSHGDYVVNQSRVFSLLGGDILMWSSTGNIDAGRGAKTAVSAPAPIITLDSEGNAIINVGGAIAGSGIRAITIDDNVLAGNVDLFAPQGVVDAGDAGIGGNNITIGATAVLGADNFDIGGISVGVPNADTGNLAAGLAGLGDVSSSVTKSMENVMDGIGEVPLSNTPLSDAVLSYLEVFVLGFGEEGESGDNSGAGDAYGQ